MKYGGSKALGSDIEPLLLLGLQWTLFHFAHKQVVCHFYQVPFSVANATPTSCHRKESVVSAAVPFRCGPAANKHPARPYFALQFYKVTSQQNTHCCLLLWTTCKAYWKMQIPIPTLEGRVRTASTGNQGLWVCSNKTCHVLRL